MQEYPLPAEEQKALVRASIASEGLILAAGIVAAMVLSVMQGGWANALPFGWAADIAATMRPHWAMFVLPVAMIMLLECMDALGWRFSETYRRAVMDTRQGVTGEMPRMGMGAIVGCMTAAGICEELLFRYGLLGIAVLVLQMALPHAIAAAVAVLMVSVAFAAVHVQYRSAWTLVYVAGISCLLGGVYLATGSLLSLMFAHAVYNIADLIVERRKMMREPDYFGGKVPVNALAEFAKGTTSLDRTDEGMI